ncbi:MAG: hypothetical protein Q8K34_13760 [Hydrogenophaga sp.]|nr:hypothetical protein [Hydrogenophaga sp.]MDP3927250.1 hypothetical protein [Hydrogenophaga sp.]
MNTSQRQAQALPLITVFGSVAALAQLLPTALPQPAPKKTAPRLESALAARVVLVLAEGEAGKAQLARSLGQQIVSGLCHNIQRNSLF